MHDVTITRYVHPRPLVESVYFMSVLFRTIECQMWMVFRPGITGSICSCGTPLDRNGKLKIPYFYYYKIDAKEIRDSSYLLIFLNDLECSVFSN